MTPLPSSLKVLEVVQPESGGAAIHVAYLCAHLSRRGHDVTVVGPPTSILASPDVSDYRYHALPNLVREPDPVEDLLALKDMIGLLRSSDWDVVHFHSSKAGFLGRIAAVVSRTKAAVVYTPHCFAFLANMGSAPTVAYRVLERFAGRVGDTILVSRWEYLGGWEASVLRARRAWIVPNGIAMDGALAEARAQLSDRRDGASRRLEAPTIGTVTRLQRAKGVDVFLEMAAKIRERVHDARFVIVGDGPDEDVLQSQAERLGLADSCKFVGHSNDVAGHLARFDVFVLSSRYESHPLALLEAMAARLPVVATAVGGVPEIVRNGIDGVLVPPNDPAAAAHAVQRLLNDWERASRLAASGRRRYERAFTPGPSARDTEHLYLRLVARP
ncbi:MAG: glycosyltransferase [Actinobacteria bacterium]|nr:glycosyltransferase [Actinomycetota bacterium]